MRTESLVSWHFYRTQPTAPHFTPFKYFFDVGSIREAFTYVSEHAQWLESKTSRPAAKAMLRNFSTQAQTAFRALDAIENPEGDHNTGTVQADLQQLVQQCLQEVSVMAKSRNVSLDVVWPTSNQLVWVDPKEVGTVLNATYPRIRSALKALVKVHHFSNDTTVSFHWSWKAQVSVFVKQAQQVWEKHDNVPDIIKPMLTPVEHSQSQVRLSARTRGSSQLDPQGQVEAHSKCSKIFPEQMLDIHCIQPF